MARHRLDHRAIYLFDGTLGYEVRWVALTELLTDSFAIQSIVVDVCQNDRLRSARRLIEKHGIKTEVPRTNKDLSNRITLTVDGTLVIDDGRGVRVINAGEYL